MENPEKSLPVPPAARGREEARRFPVMTGKYGGGQRFIPWSIAEEAYAGYSGEQGTGQSLERLAERGGFHEHEMDAYVPDWRERTSEIHQLRETLATRDWEIEELRAALRKIGELEDPIIMWGIASKVLTATEPTS